MLSAIFSSFALVAASEMGDKTQLLAFSLAARYKAPWTIMLGILIATLLNHAVASAAGSWVSLHIAPNVLAAGLGVTFIAFGLWTLKPDTFEETKKPARFGPLVTTIVLFFLAEMGDKTQLATVALGARYASAVAVTLGTTAGMLLADGLAVFLGESLAERVSMNRLRQVAAALFFVFGVLSLVAAYSA